MVDGPPEIVPLAVDLDENLVQVSPPVARTQAFDTPLSKFRGKHRPEPVPLEPHCFMANVDAPLVQKVLHVSKRKREPDLHHHRKTDDLGTRFEVPEGAVLCHALSLARHPRRLKPGSLDSALNRDRNHRRNTAQVAETSL